MTSQPTVRDLERLLRAAAPDEPATLPALVLPGGVGAFRGASVRFRGDRSRPTGMRLAYAVVALLLALAVVIGAGAVRLLERDDPLATTCDPNLGGLDGCLPVTVPDGWVDLGAGQFQVGEFSEPGLGYAFVQQVLASAPLGACPTPGGPFPEAVPSGDGEYVEVPLPTPDAGLACLRAAVLPENGVRIVTFRGMRVLGGDAETGGIPDHSEPTAEAGWTETVAGRPARLTVVVGPSGQPAETRIWDVLWPGSIETVLRIRADIAGPDLDAGRATVQEVVDAVDFGWNVPPLEEGNAGDVLRRVLDQLDRGARESSHSDLYSCFPREPGSRAGVIRGSEAGPLAAALQVTCASSIERSIAGVWRINLDITWAAGDGYAGDTLRTEYFSTGQSYGMGGIDIGGGYTTSLAGRTADWNDPQFSWLPNANHELPPVLTGPLSLPPGSLARILWPGESVAGEPGGGDDSLYPSIVGTHVWVIDGPVVVDGEEWYQVQSGTQFPPEMGWMRGTRDGRPQLETIQPDCPAADGITVGDLTWLIAAERVACFADQEITIEHGVFGFEPGYANAECLEADGVVRPCPTPAGDSAWLAAMPTWWLFGAGGREGPEPGMAIWLAPGVAAPADGQAARVRGHFDDPLAGACRLVENPGFPFGDGDDDDLKVLLCRERFVITSIEPR
jgi:hypothetical protein